MQIHEKENPNYWYEEQEQEQFKCDICQGTFSSQSNLKRHTESIHIKDKHEFECNQCDKTFERHDNFASTQKNIA
jgi:uncharacterized Zn-finger protein